MRQSQSSTPIDSLKRSTKAWVQAVTLSASSTPEAAVGDCLQPLWRPGSLAALLDIDPGHQVSAVESPRRLDLVAKVVGLRRATLRENEKVIATAEEIDPV